MLSRRQLLAAAPSLGVPATLSLPGRKVSGELRNGLLFVSATIRSGSRFERTGLFLIDTGAPVTVLDQSFAQAAEVQTNANEVIVGVGGAKVAGRGQRIDLLIGALEPAPVEPSITDLGPVAKRMGVPLAGIVGSDFLSRFVRTELDYRHGAIWFSSFISGVWPRGVPMRFGRTPYVRATAVLGDKRAEGEFQIDTGANTAVVLWKPFAERAFPGAGAVSGAVQGVAGVSQARIGRLTALEVAGQRLVDLQANFADEVRPDDAGRDHAGVIGGPAFAGRRIIIDYPGQRFWFA